MRLLRLLLALSMCVAIVACWGCSGANNPNTIKIVSSLPRTGSAKQQTDTMINAIRMALEEANYKVGDFTIRYDDLDDATASAGQATGDQETANALKAANDPNVMAYIGPYNSGVAKMSMPILNQAGLLMISPANTAVGLTKPGHRRTGRAGSTTGRPER